MILTTVSTTAWPTSASVTGSTEDAAAAVAWACISCWTAIAGISVCSTSDPVVGTIWGMMLTTVSTTDWPTSASVTESTEDAATAVAWACISCWSAIAGISVCSTFDPAVGSTWGIMLTTVSITDWPSSASVTGSTEVEAAAVAWACISCWSATAGISVCSTFDPAIGTIWGMMLTTVSKTDWPTSASVTRTTEVEAWTMSTSFMSCKEMGQRSLIDGRGVGVSNNKIPYLAFFFGT